MTDDKPIRIRRAAHDAEKRYFLMSRASAQDRALSHEARGVLAYLLSKPSDWVVQVKDLQQPGCGRDKVYRILKELEEQHYLQRAFTRVKGTVQGIEYVVYEEPFTEKADTAEADTPQADTPNTEHTEDREEPQKTEKEQITESSSPAREFNIFSLYHETFGELVANPILADKLKDMAATYAEQDIRDAFKETALANTKNMNYTSAILKRWQAEGRAPKGAKKTPAPKPTATPQETRLKALKAQFLTTQPELPPDTYLPDKPPAERLTSWRMAGRVGAAVRLAAAQLEQETQ